MVSRIQQLGTRRLRALVVAVLALAFSAGLAFAHEMPDEAAWGLANAAEHAGMVVPVGHVEESVDETEDVEDVDDTDEAETEELESEDAGDNCATDPTVLTDEELDAMRHGSVVCWAAQQDTPEGFDNHGQWVSSWAKTKSAKDDVAAAAKGQGQAHGRGPNR